MKMVEHAFDFSACIAIYFLHSMCIWMGGNIGEQLEDSFRVLSSYDRRCMSKEFFLVETTGFLMKVADLKRLEITLTC